MTTIRFQVSLTYSSVARSNCGFLSIYNLHCCDLDACHGYWCTGYIVLIDQEIYLHIYVPWSRLNLKFYTLLYKYTLTGLCRFESMIGYNFYSTIAACLQAILVSSKSAQEGFAKKTLLFGRSLHYLFWRIILPFYHVLQIIAKSSTV